MLCVTFGPLLWLILRILAACARHSIDLPEVTPIHNWRCDSWLVIDWH